MTHGVKWLFVGEVASRLRRSEQTVRKYIREGRLVGKRLGAAPGARGGGPWQVAEEEVERFEMGGTL